MKSKNSISGIGGTIQGGDIALSSIYNTEAEQIRQLKEHGGKNSPTKCVAFVGLGELEQSCEVPRKTRGLLA